jgi:hypothetical protein
MDRRIVGFHQDDEQQWVATLDCGHTQHLRHDPPWQERSWVLDPVTRSAHLGTILTCPLCDDAPLDLPHPSAYQDAKLQGLCEDGAAEIRARRREHSS